MDELRKKSDKELKKIEDEIERIYKDAEDDLRDKWDKYMSRAEKRVEGAEKALQDAMKTGDAETIAAAKAELTQKKQAVFFRDKQFSEMVDAVTDRIANVNQLAADYVNGQMPAMYRYNYNGSLREVQKDAEASGISGIAFNMIDDATVARMQKQGEVTLPKRKIDVPKDKQWNKKALNSQIMQGIIQGESIPQMSKRLREVTDMNKTSSIRNARTMTTEAENGGRLDSMKEAEELGLEYEKTWLASHDDRTRLSHALLDGETVGLDEPFSNGLQYPADPSGPPEEVYNCRCSLVRKLVGFKGKHIDAAGYEPTYFADAQQEAAENPPTETELHETAEAYEEESAYSGSLFTQKQYEMTSEDMPERPTRPRMADFEGDYEAYYEARDKYKEERERFEQKQKDIVNSWLNENRTIETKDDFLKWAEGSGVTVTGSFAENVDPKLLDEIARTQQEMFERFPEVKERQDTFYKWQNNFDANGDYLMEAGGGYNFGPKFTDAEKLYETVISEQVDGYLTKGDGTLQTLIRHEYGHNADSYIRDKFSTLNSTYADHVSGKEQRRMDARRQYEKELVALTKEHGSEYSLYNEAEAFAEGFAEYTSNPSSTYGKAFGEFFNRWYYADDIQ